MNRFRFAGAGLLAALLASAALLAAIPGALAQAPPPPIPGLFYGTVTGGPVVGDAVVAFVNHPGGTAQCGTTNVLTDAGQAVYAIDVAADHVDSPGCGAPGRVVRFYFPRTGQYANQSGTWAQGTPQRLNLTAGAAASFRNFVPNAANDAPH